MAVVYSDTFTYSDGHLSVANSSWVILGAGGLDLASGAVIPTPPGNSDGGNVWQGDTWPNDQYGQVAVNGGAAGDENESGMGLILRYTDDTHFFRIVANGRATNNITVAQVNGTYSQLAQITQAFSAGDVLKAQVVGSSPPTIQVFRNGSQIGSDITNGAAALASGDAGLYYSSSATGMSVDSFEGGDAPAGGGTTYYGATTFTVTATLVVAGQVIQVLVPTADSLDGDVGFEWTDDQGGSTLYAAVDDLSDSDYIRSVLSPQDRFCRIKLKAGGDPQSSAGHKLVWRIGKSQAGGQTVNLLPKLYQGGGDTKGGGTLIKAWAARAAPDSFTTYEETLSGAEADSITNYGDLYLEIWADVP